MLSPMGIYLAVLVIISSLSLAGAFFYLRHKNRLIWRQLWKIEEEFKKETSQIKNDFEQALKQFSISHIRKDCRLPLAMPSQQGEDVLLWNFFERKMTGYYVEVGAFDGVTHSNTYFFEAIGWHGILVEAGPENYSKCISARPHSQVIHGAVGLQDKDTVDFTVAEGLGDVGAFSYVGHHVGLKGRVEARGGTVRTVSVPAMTLNQILSDVREKIDFVSIDVEGMELEVLQGLDVDRVRPRVFLVEDNSQGRDVLVGDFLRNHGYEERYRRGQNVFYVQEGDPGKFAWVI